MRPLAKLLALAVAVALLLPGLAAAFAACAMADCPMMDGGGAGEHDCCPPAPATVSMDCCDHAPTALAAVSVLPERDPAAIVALRLGVLGVLMSKTIMLLEPLFTT